MWINAKEGDILNMHASSGMYTSMKNWHACRLYTRHGLSIYIATTHMSLVMQITLVTIYNDPIHDIINAWMHVTSYEEVLLKNGNLAPIIINKSPICLPIDQRLYASLYELLRNSLIYCLFYFHRHLNYRFATAACRVH